MRIGMISFSTFLTGVDLIIKRFLPNLLNEHSVIGMKIDRHGVLTLDKFQQIDLSFSIADQQPKKLQLSYPFINGTCKKELAVFDKVIMFGDGETLDLKERLTREFNTDILFIPVSIHNDVKGSETTVGYDTVINSIANMAFKIQDTIDSLKYPNPRLFGVQIPGNAPEDMLDEVASITNGYYLVNNFTEEIVRQLKRNFEITFSRGQTYSFLIFNGETSEERIKEEVLPSLKVDWKMLQIDEALCMGPNPTAFDRLLTSKIAEEVTRWVHNDLISGNLLIKNRKVIFSGANHKGVE